jgi:carbamoyl-phosphate synthase large subunit
MKKISVLITGAGTATCQSVIKGFRQQKEIDVRVTTVDVNPDSAGRYFSHSFYAVPMAKEPNFLDELLNICKKEKIQLLIPIVDYEFQKIARNKNLFEEFGCKVAISSPETISIFNEKDKTYKFFKENNIPTPKTYSPEELKKPNSLKYPLFMKPREGRATLDVHKINNPQELEYYSSISEDFIVQDFHAGKEFTIDALTDFEGNVIEVLPRQRIETKVGLSYKGITVKDDEMIRYGKLIMEKGKIIGHCNIQFFKTDKGIIFFEANPRYSGTLVLSLAAGFNSPLLLAKIALGEKVKPRIGQFEDGVLMLRYWEEVFVGKDGKVKPIPKLT